MAAKFVPPDTGGGVRMSPFKPADGGPTATGAGPSNLQILLEKLKLRSSRLLCTPRDARVLREVLLTGHLPKSDKKLPAQRSVVQRLDKVLAELASDPDVTPGLASHLAQLAPAYEVENEVNVEDFLQGALTVQPRLLAFCIPVVPGLLLIFWVLLAPCIYCPMMNWSFMEGLYFGLMIVSTVGSPEVSLTKTEHKVVTIFYLFGSALLLFLNVVHVVCFFVARVEGNVFATLRLASCSSATPDHPNIDQLVSDSPCFDHPSTTAREPVASSSRSERRGDRQRKFALFVATSFFALVVIAFIGALSVHYAVEDVSFLNALYWCTTVSSWVGTTTQVLKENFGSGDTHILNVVYIFAVSLCCLLSLLGVGLLCLDGSARRVRAALSARELSAGDLADIDVTHEGLSKLEYFIAALLISGRVSAQDITKILFDFRKMDPLHRGRVYAVDLAKCKSRSIVSDPDWKMSQAAHQAKQEGRTRCIGTQDDTLSEENRRLRKELEARKEQCEGLTTKLEKLLHLQGQHDSAQEQLISTLQSQRHTEQLLQQALCKQQELYGEVGREKQRCTQMENELDSTKRARCSVEDRLQTYSRQCQDLTRRLEEAQLAADGSARTGREEARRASAAEARVLELEKAVMAADCRAREAEAEREAISRQLRDALQEATLANRRQMVVLPPLYKYTETAHRPHVPPPITEPFCEPPVPPGATLLSDRSAYGIVPHSPRVPYGGRWRRAA